METDPNQKKIKVLICNDNEVIRIYLRDIFWVNGFESTCEILDAADLDQAEKLVNDPEKRPDIIFLGVLLKKKVDGQVKIDPSFSLAFARHIKSDPTLHDTKVLMFSPHAEDKLKTDVENADVDKYIYSDHNLPEDLVVIINNLIKEVRLMKK